MNQKKQQSLFQPEPDPWVQDHMDDFYAARVVLSDPPFGPLDYSVPAELRSQVKIGSRLEVPLGRGGRKIITWCVDIITPDSGELAVPANKLRPIHSVYDATPLINGKMLELADWMSEYYMTPLGSVIETMVPAGVRTASGTRQVAFFQIHPDYKDRWKEERLSEGQRAVMQELSRYSTEITSAQITKQLGCTSSPIQSLKKRGLLSVRFQRVHSQPFAIPTEEKEQPLTLSSEQTSALDRIKKSIESSKYLPILLHGVTGSGKTEVYLQAISEIIASGRQAIVLVPEISLTPQTRQRFRRRFDRIAVLHSQLTNPQRHWHWQQIASGQVDVVIGTRSAIFAPVPHLGLVVIDEEHDGSFKQDKAPRYHARLVARKRAHMSQVPLIVGSATPSMEMWAASHGGNFDLLSMPTRVAGRPLPEVKIVDTRKSYQPKGKTGSLSLPLVNAMKATLDDDGQVILLLNRRGYSTSIQCPSCGDVVQCKDCDLALTHHRDTGKAVCHFCDYQMPVPNVCPTCDFVGIQFFGLGTQKLELEVKSRFPDIPMIRMDTDTMRRPGSHEKALHEFRQGNVKILLGTQMIAKGLDFPNVTLVGVINADTGLHMPDFRARERVFGLLTQVAGRTGRGPKGGRVIVQTFNPDDPAIVAASEHDYIKFATEEVAVRKALNYPPFGSMARIIVRSESELLGEETVNLLGQKILQFASDASRKGNQNTTNSSTSSDSSSIPGNNLGVGVIGPAPAPVTRLRGFYRFHLLVTSPAGFPIGRLIKKATEGLSVPDSVQWVIDIDPLDMM